MGLNRIHTMIEGGRTAVYLGPEQWHQEWRSRLPDIDGSRTFILKRLRVVVPDSIIDPKTRKQRNVEEIVPWIFEWVVWD